MDGALQCNFTECAAYRLCPHLGASSFCCPTEGGAPAGCCPSLRLPGCAQDDLFLAKWTFMRYVVLGSFMAFRFWKLARRAERLRQVQKKYKWEDPFVGEEPFEKHPKISMKLAEATWLPTKFFWAGCLFIQSEGVGLAVYFAVSAMMDNFTIFFVHDFCFCKYVTSVALYTLALGTFLPTAAFAYIFQHRWYEDKPWNPLRAERWHQSKVAFIAIMTLITVLFFILRLELLKAIGWDATVDAWLSQVEKVKVSFAICVPPLVDLIQSLLLVAAVTLRHAREGAALPDHHKEHSTTQFEAPLLAKRGLEQVPASHLPPPAPAA